MAAITYLTLRVYGKEIAFTDVKAGTYTPAAEPSDLDDARDATALYAVAKDVLENAEKRRAHVTDKCKTLLTIGSLCIGIIGLMLPKYLTSDTVALRILCILAAIAAFNAILLTFTFFDVGREQQVSVDATEAKLRGEQLKKSLLKTYLACATASNARTDYLIEVYLAARFCLLTAFTLVAIAIVLYITFNSATDPADRILREVRSNDTMINLLRGPKGDAGEKGEKGDPGLTPTMPDVVTRILSDPRFAHIIDRAVAQKMKGSQQSPPKKAD